MRPFDLPGPVSKLLIPNKFPNWHPICIGTVACLRRARRDRHHRISSQESNMKIILKKLGLVRGAPSAAPNGNHMSPWHPLFSKAVTLHILETTTTRSSLTR